MSTAQTIGLGAIAGVTIFLGLPAGRIKSSRIGFKTFLTGASAGILIFLLFDILKHATEPVETAVTSKSWSHLAALLAVYAAGLGIGLLSLFYVNKWRRPKQSVGPGAMAVAEIEAHDHTKREALRLGMSIAIGIGLHNFSEGLAIGQAADRGEVSLALILVIGFALHNATEGFGIVGPLAAGGVRASWKWLALAGLIGGGPTFIGTVIGTAVTSELVFVAFLALAAGAIVYVLGELFAAGRRMSWEAMLWGVLTGIIVALGTELVVVASGV